MSEPMVDEDELQNLTERGMTPEEETLANQVYAAIQQFTHDTPRSQQARDFLLGVSDLGTCSERTRRLLAEIPEAEAGDKLEAFMGSAVGDYVERALLAAYPEVTSQATVSTVLHGDGGDYELTGHPDLIHPWGIGDVKSVDGLSVVRRTGPTQQQLFQRHLYTKAAHEAGLLACELDKAKTYNVWIDRSGRTKELFVHMDTYNPDIVASATHWLDEVVYAWKQGIEAQKEPPRPWCEKVCGHFASCRLYDTDVEGMIRDPEIIAAVALHKEASALEKQAKTMKKDASAVLAEVNGYIPGWQIRNTWVNPTDVAFSRKGYFRLSITKMK